MQNTALLIRKGQNRKSQKMEFRLKSAILISFVMLNEEPMSFCHKKCMKFSGQTSDQKTTME